MNFINKQTNVYMSQRTKQYQTISASQAPLLQISVTLDLNHNSMIESEVAELTKKKGLRQFQKVSTNNGMSIQYKC